MAFTASDWTAWTSTTTDAEPLVGDVLPSDWTAWSSATTFTPEQTDWWVAKDAAWIPAALFTEWTTP